MAARHRSRAGCVQYAHLEHGVRNPLKGFGKPAAQPRSQSFSPDDKHDLYDVTDEPFRDFLFVAIHTGLRPFCELAKLTANHVEVSPRGMLWRVYSSRAIVAFCCSGRKAACHWVFPARAVKPAIDPRTVRRFGSIRPRLGRANANVDGRSPRGRPPEYRQCLPGASHSLRGPLSWCGRLR
jgi:hypothetical protein